MPCPEKKYRKGPDILGSNIRQGWVLLSEREEKPHPFPQSLSVLLPRCLVPGDPALVRSCSQSKIK